MRRQKSGLSPGCVCWGWDRSGAGLRFRALAIASAVTAPPPGLVTNWNQMSVRQLRTPLRVVLHKRAVENSRVPRSETMITRIR